MQGKTTLENEYLRVELSQKHAAILQIYDSDNRPWLWRAPSEAYHPELGGCFPLVPYSNRIENRQFNWNGRTFEIASDINTYTHALHGDGWLSDWEYEEIKPASVRLSHIGRLFPFNYCASMEITLQKNQVKLVLSVTHQGQSAIPYGLGFHPWFLKEYDTQIFAPAQKVWLEDNRHLPTELVDIPASWRFDCFGKRTPDDFMNNLFIGWHKDERNRHLASLSYPSKDMTIDIDVSSTLDRYIIYSTGDDFICFEPVSHNVNAFNTKDLGGLSVLSPDTTLEVDMILTFNKT